MCRLFGLSAGRERVPATFWLLEAPDSLAEQSHLNPDGAGLGTYDEDGSPVVEKQPIAAWSDVDFVREARERTSRTFLAHVRYATEGAVTQANTHPFAMDGRIFAHNGGIGDLPILEEHLGPDLGRVHGGTDSERIFALISREAELVGDLETGLVTALTWLAEHVRVVSLNLVLTTDTALFAVRYPDARELYLLDRRGSTRGLDHRSRHGTRIRAGTLAHMPSVVVASEPLDDDTWQPLAAGELAHVDEELRVHRRIAFPDAPTRQVSTDQLSAGS